MHHVIRTHRKQLKTQSYTRNFPDTDLGTDSSSHDLTKAAKGMDLETFRHGAALLLDGRGTHEWLLHTLVKYYPHHWEIPK
jgi:hypothetical protein